MNEKKDDFKTTNQKYQKCLNNFYIRFLEGEAVDMNKVCQDELDALKTFKEYQNLNKEFNKLIKEGK
jgi:hypothetical protein